MIVLTILLLMFITTQALGATQEQIDQITTVIERLCLSGNNYQLKANVAGSVRFLKIAPGGKAGIDVDVKNSKGGVNYLNEQIRLEFDKQTRDCMQPHIDKLINIILGGSQVPPKKLGSDTKIASQSQKPSTAGPSSPAKSRETAKNTSAKDTPNTVPADQPKPAIIAITNTKVTRDNIDRTTVMEVTFQNLGERETVVNIRAVTVLNNAETDSNSPPPSMLAAIPGQNITLALSVSNRSQEGFDAIWNAQHSLGVKVEIDFTATEGTGRRYVYRGVLIPKRQVLNTIQSEYFPLLLSGPKVDINLYVKGWGFVGDGHSLMMNVETAELIRYSGAYWLMGAAILHDPEISNMTDRRLQKSAFEEITGKRKRIEFPVDEDFKRRINSQKSISLKFYLCLVPKKFRLDQIYRLDDVFSLGGQVLGQPSIESTNNAIPMPSQ